MANSNWADRVTRNLERGGSFAGSAGLGGARKQELRGEEGAVAMGATRTEEWQQELCPACKRIIAAGGEGYCPACADC